MFRTSLVIAEAADSPSIQLGGELAEGVDVSWLLTSCHWFVVE
jgi:hypothetical protein